MCRIVGNQIICGGELDFHEEHECNENGIVYGLSDGERIYFDNSDEAREWYDTNYQKTNMSSVCCSICGHAAIDDAWKLDFFDEVN